MESLRELGNGLRPAKERIELGDQENDVAFALLENILGKETLAQNSNTAHLQGIVNTTHTTDQLRLQQFVSFEALIKQPINKYLGWK